MEKCISVPHDRKNMFAFLLMREKYFLTESVSKKKKYKSTMKIPDPPPFCWTMQNNLNPLQHRIILAEAKWKWIQFYWDQIFLQAIPSKIVIGFVKQKAVNGDYTANPFNFQHFSLTDLTLYVNENSVPGRPLKMEFGDNRNYETVFTRLFDYIAKSVSPWKTSAMNTLYLHHFALVPCDLY